MYKNEIEEAIRQLFEVSTLLTRLKHAIDRLYPFSCSPEVEALLNSIGAKKKSAGAVQRRFSS